MAGRPRKATTVLARKISKEDREARSESEVKYKIDRNNLKPPKWLSPIATAEFERVVNEAGKAEFLDNLDLTVLAIYADNYSRYVEAVEKLNEGELTNTTDSGYKQISPYLSILNQCTKNIFSCSTKLGLTTTDRLKLMVPEKAEKEPENKFFKYLGSG